jgi:hypothetical protein
MLMGFTSWPVGLALALAVLMGTSHCAFGEKEGVVVGLVDGASESTRDTGERPWPSRLPLQPGCLGQDNVWDSSQVELQIGPSSDLATKDPVAATMLGLLSAEQRAGLVDFVRNDSFLVDPIEHFLHAYRVIEASFMLGHRDDQFAALGLRFWRQECAVGLGGAREADAPLDRCDMRLVHDVTPLDKIRRISRVLADVRRKGYWDWRLIPQTLLWGRLNATQALYRVVDAAGLAGAIDEAHGDSSGQGWGQAEPAGECFVSRKQGACLPGVGSVRAARWESRPFKRWATVRHRWRREMPDPLPDKMLAGGDYSSYFSEGAPHALTKAQLLAAAAGEGNSGSGGGLFVRCDQGVLSRYDGVPTAADREDADREGDGTTAVQRERVEAMATAGARAEAAALLRGICSLYAADYGCVRRGTGQPCFKRPLVCEDGAAMQRQRAADGCAQGVAEEGRGRGEDEGEGEGKREDEDDEEEDDEDEEQAQAAAQAEREQAFAAFVRGPSLPPRIPGGFRLRPSGRPALRPLEALSILPTCDAQAIEEFHWNNNSGLERQESDWDNARADDTLNITVREPA